MAKCTLCSGASMADSDTEVCERCEGEGNVCDECGEPGPDLCIDCSLNYDVDGEPAHEDWGSPL